MKSYALGLALIASAAAAQNKPTLIDYPLDVRSTIAAAQLTMLQDDFRQMLAKNPAVLLSTRSNWKVAVAALKRQDCDVRNECLQQLAVVAGALYAIYASVERNAASTEVTATGRIVNQDGVQVRPPAKVTVRKSGSFEEAARTALSQLIEKLELTTLSPVLGPPPVETRPTPIVEAKPIEHPTEEFKRPEPAATRPPEVAVSVPPPEPKLPGLRVGAFVVGGLAVGSAAVAAGFGISAAAARAALPADGRLINADQVRTQSSVNQGATIALASGLAAGALAVTSIVLFGVSSSSSAASVSVTPASGGATLAVGGAF